MGLGQLLDLVDTMHTPVSRPSRTDGAEASCLHMHPCSLYLIRGL